MGLDPRYGDDLLAAGLAKHVLRGAGRFDHIGTGQCHHQHTQDHGEHSREIAP